MQDSGALRRRLLLLCGTALQAAAWLLAPPACGQTLPPNALPQGGHVVAGRASIATAPGTLQIAQTSQRAVLDWTSFDVGRDASVQFVQPGAAATAFNRVTGPDPSQIAGHITANGQVVLVNQSGVVFTGSAQVNVQSLVVATANISNRNAMAGRLVFDQPGRANAAVVNQGRLTVKDTGLAALVAPAVANAGTITARMGRVVLAAGTRATLDLYGDGLLPIDVTGQVREVPVGPDGRPVAALVTNTGTILAAGGQIALSARAVDGLVQDLVSAGGRIAADNAQGAGGRVVLAGIGGSLTMPGRISATGRTGGQVTASATQAVALAPGGSIDASGRTRGGSVTLRGRSASVAADARIAADATAGGAGGRVRVLGGSAVAMQGRISARGAGAAGAGGAVQVSGGHALALTGGIDVSGRAALGSILIDPASLTIETGGSSTLGQSTLSVATLDGLAGHVVLQATDSIEVRDAVAMTQPGASLSLLSGGDITVQAAISVPGSLSLAAGAALPGAPGAGSILVQGGVRLSAQSVALGAVQAGGRGGLLRVADGGTASVLASSAISLDGAVTGGTLDLAPATAQVVQLGGSAAAPGTFWVDLRLDGFTAPAGLSPGTLRVGALSADGSGATATAIDIAGLSLRGSNAALVPINLDLQVASGGSITERPGAGLAGIATLTGRIAGGGGDIRLDQLAENRIAALGALAAGGSVTLADASSLTVSALTPAGRGGVVSGAGVALSSSGSLTLAGAVTATGDLSLSAAGGGIVQTAGALAAATLFGAAAGDATLDGANRIGTLGAFTASGTLALADAAGLTVTAATPSGGTGAVRAAGVALTLASGDLLIGGRVVAAGAMTLDARGGAIGETLPGQATATGVLAAATLNARAGSDMVLTGANAIGTLGTVSAVGTLAVSNSQGLVVQGAAGGSVALSTTAGDLLLQGSATALGDMTLLAAGTITQTAGRIVAGTLVASAGGAVRLPSGDNFVIQANSLAAGASLALVDSTALRLRGPVTGDGVSLQADGLTLASTVGVPQTATLTLVSSGGISETASGSITAGSLAIRASGTVTLAQPGNAVAALVGVTAAGVTLSDAEALMVAAPVTAGSIALQAPSLVLNAMLAAGPGAAPADTIALAASAGGIVQTGGVIATSVLTLSAAGPASLAASGNAIATLADATLPGQRLTLADNVPLSAGGPITAASVSLRAPSLTLAGAIAAGQSVTLVATRGGIVESDGSIATAVLNATSASDIVLPSATNAIASLGTILAPGANISIIDGGDITVAGSVQGGMLAIFSLGGAITLAGGITASEALSLSAATDLVQIAGTVQSGAGGMSASAGTGSLRQSGGALLSAGDSNLFVGSGTDEVISLAGRVQAAGTLVLFAGGPIDQGVIGAGPAGPGQIVAAVLSGSAGGAITLSGSGNAIATVQGLTAGAGALLLRDSIAVQVAGSVGNCNGGVTLASAGGIAIGAPGNPATLYATGDLAIAAVDDVTLAGSGTTVIGQAGIVITTPRLNQSDGVLAASGTLDVAGSLAQSGGTIASGGTFSLAGGAVIGGVLAAATLSPALAVTGLPWLTLQGGSFVTESDLALGGYALSGGNLGTIVTSGAVQANSLTIAEGGAVLAGGGIRIVAELSQSGGTLVAGGTLSVGTGSTAAAGLAGSTALAGTIAQSGGTLAAQGDIDLWSVAALSLGGSVLSGSRLGLTAAAVSQTGGVLFGQSGVAVLASAGDAAQQAGATLASAGGAISVLAPFGRNAVNDFALAKVAVQSSAALTVAVDCGCSGVPPEASGSTAVVAFQPPTIGLGALGPASGVAVSLLGDSIAVDRTLSAGALALYARSGITEAPSAAITALSLTGSAGVAEAGSLAPGLLALDPGIAAAWPSAGPASAALLGAGNSLAVLDGFTATGDLRISATAPGGVLALQGAFSAGAASNTAEIDSLGGMALAAGVSVTGAAVVLTGPDKQVAGAQVLAFGPAGLVLEGGTTGVAPGSLLLASSGGMALDAVVQSGGSIAAAGAATLASLTQSAGVLASGGDLALGVLLRASGSVGAGGGLSGRLAGTTTAGTTLDGTLAALGALSLQGSGALVLAGTLAAQGSLSITAGAVQQSAGLISGAAGVTLTATIGDARQAAGAEMGGGVGAAGILVQAPRGSVAFDSFVLAATVAPGSLPVPLPVIAPQAAAAREDVTLSGGSVAIAGPLRAGVLALVASGGITEAPGAAIDALSLTGSAGGAALLAGANSVGTLAGFRAGQDLLLGVAGGLEVAAPVQAADVTIAAGGALTLAADVTATGATGRLIAGAPRIAIAGGTTLRGWRIALTATDSITSPLGGSVSFAGGGLAGSGALAGGQAGFSAPRDDTSASTPGVLLTIAENGGGSGYGGLNAATGSGVIALGTVAVSGGLLRLALPDNLQGQPGSAASSGSITLGDVGAAGADMILWIGNGSASGTLSARQLALFYTGTNAAADLGGLLFTAQGSPVSGIAAAFLAGIGRYVGSGQILYSALPSVRFATCPISSINCQIVDLRQSIPPLEPVANDMVTLTDAPDDPDVLLPNISDRDY